MRGLAGRLASGPVRSESPAAFKSFTFLRKKDA